MDFFFVNGIPLIHTKLRKIFFSSVQACNRRANYETILGLNQVKTKYKYRGLIITDYHSNNEFEHICKVFSTRTSAHMRHKLAHWGHQEIYQDNQGSSKMWMSLHTIQ